jgi:hypothetical protein
VSGRALVVVAVAVALLAPGCQGPSDSQIACAVLVATPVVFVLATLVQLVLLAMWRRAGAEIVIDLRRQAFAVVPLVGVAIFGGTQPRPATDLWVVAVFVYGASYLALLLVATRAWISLRPQHALIAPHIVPVVVLVVPALIAAGLEGSSSIGELSAMLDVVVGWFGVVPGLLLIALLIEAWTRRPKPKVNE